MSLENLLKIGQLKEHPVNPDEIRKILDAAQRNLRDAGIQDNSPETRFDCAYKAIMQSAIVALMAHGYRPSTNVPGHQMTTIQALTHTINLDGNRMSVLDTLRRKRNLNDYTGADLDEDSAEACINEAVRLLDEVGNWIRDNRPELL